MPPKSRKKSVRKTANKSRKGYITLAKLRSLLKKSKKKTSYGGRRNYSSGKRSAAANKRRGTVRSRR